MNLSAATSLFAMAMRPRLFASKPTAPEPVQGPLRAVLEASQTVLCVTDAIGVVRSITSNASRILGDGADRAAELEVPLGELLQIEDVSEIQAAIDELTRSDMGATCIWVFRTRARKGGQRWLEVVGANYLFESQIAGLFLQIRDVTKTYPAQQRHELAGLAAELSPDTVIITDAQGVIEYVNPAFEKISGYRLSDVRGRTPAVLKSDRQPADFFLRMWNALKIGDVFRGEVTNRKKTGEVYYEDLQIQPIVGPNGVVTHYISVGRDITAQRRAEAVAEEAAFYDPVSGIPTYRLLRERARPLLSLARRHGHTAALIHIDLNGLHNVNVNLGRDVGDQLMRKFAERLKQGLRESDTIARLPSDEFLILLTDVAGEDATARVSRRLKESVMRPFQIREHAINLGTSFGVSMYPQDATTFDEMIDYACLAMKRAKVTGTGFEFYKKELTELTLERLSLEDDLKWAWERKQFVLHYQGVFSTANGTPIGMEALTRAHIIGADALARWPNIERGEISPAQFIPVAERTGRIVALDRWALATAARQAKLWSQEGWNGWVSVNLSARSLHDAELPGYIARCIETHEIEPGRLVLEVTESSAMREIETTAAILNQLKEAGALIALDDFGTGHSSLAYLKHFPVDILKLDHSFVAGIGTEMKQEHLITTMVDFSHRIGAQVVAEGVETKDQFEFLKDAQCDFVQGYLLARPKPADAVFGKEEKSAAAD